MKLVNSIKTRIEAGQFGQLETFFDDLVFEVQQEIEEEKQNLSSLELEMKNALASADREILKIEKEVPKAYESWIPTTTKSTYFKNVIEIKDKLVAVKNQKKEMLEEFYSDIEDQKKVIKELEEILSVISE